MRCDNTFISMNPPLPCVDENLGAGFIHELAADSAVITFATPSDAKTYSSSISISIPGEIFKLKAKLQPATSDTRATKYKILPSTEEDFGSLNDLINVVRKDQHISICEKEDVEATDKYTGFSDVSLKPKALPELAWSDLDTRQLFLEREFAAPLMIPGMTGGVDLGAKINNHLAAAADHFSIPMGVGSQRLALENPKYEPIFEVKKNFPNLFLVGNIGISQLISGSEYDYCMRAIEMIDADAMAIHVNVLQEIVQPEGDREFRGRIELISKLAASLPVPVIVKEVGAGIDPETADQLISGGVKAIDVGGKGGTSWSRIEGLRAASSATRRVADTFRDWGVPTAYSLAAIREKHSVEIVSTGGIRDGLTMAKAMALGSTMVGIGLPIFRAALVDEKQTIETIETTLREYKTAMILSGCQKSEELKTRLTLNKNFTETLKQNI